MKPDFFLGVCAGSAFTALLTILWLMMLQVAK